MALRPSHRKNHSNNNDSFDDDGFYDADDTHNHHDADVNYYENDHAQYADTYDNNNNAHYNENESWNSNQYENGDDQYSLDTKRKKKTRFTRIRPKHKTARMATSTSSFQPQPPQPNTSSFRPQPPPQSNNTASAFYNADNLQSLASAGLAAAATSGVLTDGFSARTAANLMNQLPVSIAPGILSLKYYKYYFRVHNEYVVKKLGRLLMPFLKMKVGAWKRKKIDELTNDNIAPPPQHFAHYSYQPPIYDINAPDGYIPLMAIITYIVIMGFVVGNQSASDEGGSGMTFSPQVLIATGSSAFVMLLIEVLLMKIGFYLIGSVANPPYWIDIICYTGYKLIFVTINLILNLIWANLIFYYVVSLTTGIFAAIFMIQTLRPYFRDLSEFASGPLMDVGSANEPKKTRKIFLGVVGIAQIIFIQLMGRYTSL